MVLLRQLITIFPDHSYCFCLLLKPVDHEGPYWEQLWQYPDQTDSFAAPSRNGIQSWSKKEICKLSEEPSGGNAPLIQEEQLELSKGKWQL